MSLPGSVKRMEEMFDEMRCKYLESKGWTMKCIGANWYWHLDMGDHFVNLTTVRGAIEFQSSRESFK